MANREPAMASALALARRERAAGGTQLESHLATYPRGSAILAAVSRQPMEVELFVPLSNQRAEIGATNLYLPYVRLRICVYLHVRCMMV